MDEQIINLKKDINSFIQKENKKINKYINDNKKEKSIGIEEHYNGRISAFEEILDLLENC